jgi:hypothetical protein
MSQGKKRLADILMFEETEKSMAPFRLFARLNSLDLLAPASKSMKALEG